jgi:hypothetical protein
MFVQVIKGKTSDRAGWERQGQRWIEDVRPGAKGFLGSTAGVADDGTFIIVARFESEKDARANESRPEQTAFFEEMQKYIDGEASFRESSDTATLFDGGSDSAGFVQVMEGRVIDRAKAEALENDEMLEQLRKARPDLIGSLRVWFDGGEFVDTAYFTSEADARKGETSAEFEGPQDEYMQLFGEMTFTDLKNPQFG